MTGHLLVVDSIAANRCVLKAKLSASFLDIRQAECGQEALSMIAETPPDLVIAGGDLTDMTRETFCLRHKSGGQSAAPPLIVVGPHLSRDQRLSAMRSGADDVLVSPLKDAPFLARIRCLLRARETVQGLRLQESAARIPGLHEETTSFDAPSSVVFAAQDGSDALRWSSFLKPLVPYRMRALPIGDAVRTMSLYANPDCFVIGVQTNAPEEALRFLAEIRARSTTRNSAVLMVLDREDDSTRVNALDLGANDVMAGCFDPEEAAVRLAAILARKRLTDRLSKSVEAGLNAAVTDPLTGLYNRRYALPQLERIAHHAQATGHDFAVMMADLDHFKTVNDKFGHAAGDVVLAEVARRLRSQMGAGDLIARIGGEEFLIVMHNTSAQDATQMAHRLRDVVRSTPVYLRARDIRVPVTVSIGVTMGHDSFATRTSTSNPKRLDAGLLIERADRALYSAKADGRDSVTMTRPAA
ncbi:response regulator receiver modulated diguanylate cyclase [Shimia isoporae]|uniref:diguanylate cyclase n=1 Tax=Shimia isoporae TaxID=647720 RepID=A0A4R1NNW4_9RHOB|nr:diguanylate cyclase [Shimia isoporae]TCL10166.1 response regulator receiver modulated diguanylate cyclase [Shimia isoporae]